MKLCSYSKPYKTEKIIKLIEHSVSRGSTI